MKKVYEDQDMTMVGYYQTLLEEEGIATLVKNEYAQLAVGEVPFTQVYPELWVSKDEDYEKSVELIRTVRDSAEIPEEKETVAYKNSGMMKAVVWSGVLGLAVFLVLVVYSIFAEQPY